MTNMVSNCVYLESLKVMLFEVMVMLLDVMVMLLEVIQQVVYIELLGQRKIKTHLFCASLLFVS